MLSDDIAIKVGGFKFSGWKSARVTRSIEALSASFELTATDAWEDSQDRFKLRPGASCSIEINREPILTGFIDTVSTALSASDRNITIKGRCRTADLVDCTAEAKTYKGQTLAQLCAALAGNFGISFSIAGSDPAITTFSVATGEKIFSALERAARSRGVLFLGTETGNVAVSSPGNILVLTRIVEGVNMLAGSGEFSCVERYGKYEVSGHGAGGWTSAVLPAAKATDAGARASRRLVILEDGLPADLALKRAQWEAATRAARSTKIQVSLVGWRQDSGALWKPNYIVAMVAPSLGVDGKFLISSVTYSISEAGTTTQLDLRQREAFALKPEQDKDKGVQWTM